MPDLYQETIVEHEKSAAHISEVKDRELMPPPPPPPDLSETAHPEAIEEVVTGKRGLPRTISVELQELQAKKVKKIEQAQRIAEKKRHFIFDQNTQLTRQEMERRMKSSVTGMVGPQVVGSFDQDASEQEDETILTEDMEERKRNLDLLFRSRSGWVHTKYDYLKIDLSKQPSCQLMRQTDRIFSRKELDFYPKNIYLRKNMISAKMPNDNYYYLTEQPTGESEESFERERQGASRLDEPSITRSKRDSIQGRRVSEQFKETSRVEQQEVTPAGPAPIAPTDVFRPAEEPTFFEQQQPFGESYIQPPAFPEETVTSEIVRQAEPNYGDIIMDKIKQAKKKGVILQDMIKKEPLPDRLSESKTPRHLFAAKLFSATLKLCANQKITVTQNVTYGDIQMKLY